MSSFYSESQRALQQDFGTTRMADMLENVIVHDAIAPEEAAFIGSRDMFFLSTVDPDGNPTVSYKGGPDGFVRVVDPQTLVFPGYDGNGMFLSAGNIAGQHRVGMLFISFDPPHRLRVQGEAEVVREHPLLAGYAEATFLVVVKVTKLWVNCPRYIHRYRKVEASRYAPAPGRETPMACWKRIDMVQDVLTDEERARARRQGLLTQAEYEEMVARGEG